MRRDIVEKLLARKRASLNCVKEILQDRYLTYESFEHIFTKYLCLKFMLEESDITTDNFYEICQISADKVSHLPKGMLDAAELASKCGGATTAMNKKILFLLAVNEEYGIEISAEEGVEVDTFIQLKELVYNKVIRNRVTSNNVTSDNVTSNNVTRK